MAKTNSHTTERNASNLNNNGINSAKLQQKDLLDISTKKHYHSLDTELNQMN